VSVLYVDHIQGKGEELFRLACREDVEGIVAKWCAAYAMPTA
jgi:ATP-dependent DNA ligase